MLEQAGIVRRGYDAGRAMRIELLPVEPGAGAVVDDLLERYATEARARVERIVRFAESGRCRHAQVAEHFGETLDGPCGACDVCDPRAHAAARAAPRRRFPPTSPARSSAPSQRLTWPLGRRSLVAMLRGSVSAPPSARASLAFGILEAASDAEVKRWIKALEAAGALVEVETDDGFRVLHADPGAALPSLGPKHRGPRRRLGRRAAARRGGASAPARTACRRTSCSTTRRCATSPPTRPASLHELAAVKGFGPTKIERYGDDIIAVVAASRDGSEPRRSSSRLASCAAVLPLR